MFQNKAILALEDGTTFSGLSVGAPGAATGEVVFNTAMSGYQEILTDPSYAGQLVTLTTSHVGNTGVNDQDTESARPMAAGLIVRDCPRRPSSWRATESLPEYLARHGIVAISDIDTRALTIRLREKGAMNGCILAGEAPDPQEALKRARACPTMQGQDLASVVSTEKTYEWTAGSLSLRHCEARSAAAIQKGEDWIATSATPPRDDDRQALRHVVCYDYGVKRNILRLLVDAGCRVTVVPAKFTVADTLALRPGGIMLSNGPGDPEPCDYAIDAIRELLDRKIPIFGICLGHQLLSLALGARTTKMKFGHHGANHPVKDLESGRVLITSQNHGFAVDEVTLPDNVVVTHQSLFDGSLQGIRVSDHPAFGFQGHPEASPGPHDIRYLFERFVKMMDYA